MILLALLLFAADIGLFVLASNRGGDTPWWAFLPGGGIVLWLTRR